VGLLDEQVVLITGGARGQGRAHAVASAKEGADIVITDIFTQASSVPYPMASREDMDETVALIEALGRKIIAVEADVRAQDELAAVVATAIERFGKIDSLIANAGVWSAAPLWEISDDQWEQLIDINLTGVWRSMKAVIPHMIERQSGSIILIASVNGIQAGIERAHYCASKAGVLALTRNAALELGPYNIRCNAICPGTVFSPMVDNQWTRDRVVGHPGAKSQELYALGYSVNAMRGRSYMDPELIARAGVFLNSPLADAVSGIEMPVDAGFLVLEGFNPNPIRD
jgi:SDR family mycofactocin-dependent oxidoreductase